MADVSEPTVNRFCRRLDTKGFPDFKLHLAQSLANGTPYVNRNVEEDDSVDAYTGKYSNRDGQSGYSKGKFGYCRNQSCG
jgi:DNA-binding MurR/RpiR family transcriptional regulator